jgi:hypothetical protein
MEAGGKDDFHDQADAEWIVIRGHLRGHIKTGGQPLGRIWCFSYYQLVVIYIV